MHILITGRLRLAPVTYTDLPDLVRLKADPRAFARMLGGVRSPAQSAVELADEQRYWALHGVGIWAARDKQGAFVGLTGLHDRPDGRNPALRFALRSELRGHGYAREAAGAALRHAHATGIPRVHAIAAEDNIASRTVLGAIGMRQVDRFERAGATLIVYASPR